MKTTHLVRTVRATLPLLLALAVGCTSSDPTPDPEGEPTSAPTVGAPAPAADVPYTLRLEGFTVEGFPGLHSMIETEHAGKLVMLAGRRNGMHHFPVRTSSDLIQAFPPSEANDTVWVLDLNTRTLVGSAAVGGLPAAIARQLIATNAQAVVRDGWLYVIGGYAPTADGQSMETMGQAVAIDLDALVAAVAAGEPLDAQFAQDHMHVATHPALAITGAGAELLGDLVLLVFGQQYDGLYTTDGGLAQQIYSYSVRAFVFTLPSDAGAPLEVTYQGKQPNPPATEPQPTPDGPYHRRDLTVGRVLDPATGDLRIAAFGGVFKGGRMEGYLTPIYATADASNSLGFRLDEDTDALQLLSQYECPMIPVYAEAAQVTYSTFYGGISQFHWDATTAKLVQDTQNFNASPPIDGLPFIHEISTLRVDTQGTQDYLHLEQSFPPAGDAPQQGGKTATELGSNGFFVPSADAPLREGVVLLDAIDTPQVIGHIVGSIATTGPYPAETWASATIYEVTLDPNAPTKTVALEQP
ncbi:hypothetical protein OAX78_01915 [Planctomycetota bacterium]|nr:hypothetical protein [Planctomycetota bacterium]